MFRKLVISLVICFITSACALNNIEQNDTNKESNILKSEHYTSSKTKIDKSKIQKIHISTFPKRFEDLNITDVNQISNIVDYLISITPVETKLNPGDYNGGGYFIKIQFKDSSERVFNHIGNMFFMEEDNFTYEMKYEEAIKIDSIVANIVESNMDKSGEDYIVGTIVSIKSEASGHNISCVVKDNENTYHDIYIKDASIIDSTGDGWMILHKNDQVKIYYSNSKQDSMISASKVFIKESSN